MGHSWAIQIGSGVTLLLGKELASFAPLYEVFSISHGRGPVESRSVGLTDQVGGCCMAATLAVVNLN
jgi:hypothetical protein